MEFTTHFGLHSQATRLGEDLYRPHTVHGLRLDQKALPHWKCQPHPTPARQPTPTNQPRGLFRVNRSLLHSHHGEKAFQEKQTVCSKAHLLIIGWCFWPTEVCGRGEGREGGKLGRGQMRVLCSTLTKKQGLCSVTGKSLWFWVREWINEETGLCFWFLQLDLLVLVYWKVWDYSFTFNSSVNSHDKLKQCTL